MKPFLDRVTDALAVLRGSASLENLPLTTREQVIRAAHDLGMHESGGAHSECLCCFNENYAYYMKNCCEVLIAIGHGDAIDDFKTFVQELVDDSIRHEYKEMVFYDPAEAIADFLGVERHGEEVSVEYQRIVDETMERFYK